MLKATDGWNGRAMIGGRKFVILRYADDTSILDNFIRELFQLIDRLVNISKDTGLKINREKTRIVVLYGANNQNQLTKIKNIAVVS